MATAAFRSGLNKLKKSSPDAIHAWLGTTTWKHDELFPLAMEQREPFRSNILRAQIRFPFSTKAKGPAGFAIPHDRWAVLAAVNQVAYSLIEKKKPASALELLAPWSKYAKEYPFIARNLAAAYAQTGKPSEAIKQLGVLVALKWEWVTSLETDSDLKALRNNAGFKTLYAKWKKNGQVKDCYDVDVASLKKTFPKGFAAPQLLLDFCSFLRTIPRGSVGYFDIGGATHPFFPKKKLGAHFAEFMTLGDGSDIAFWRSGDTWDAHPAIVKLGSEGEYSQLASSFEELVLKIAKRSTGEDEIDCKYAEDDGPNDHRDDLKEWLKERSIKAPKVAKRPAFASWMEPRIA